MMMVGPARLAASSLLLLTVAACGSSPIQKPANSSTDDAVNAIAANISEDDGSGATSVPTDANAVGQSMRAGAATHPPQH